MMVLFWGMGHEELGEQINTGMSAITSEWRERWVSKLQSHILPAEMQLVGRTLFSSLL